MRPESQARGLGSAAHGPGVRAFVVALCSCLVVAGVVLLGIGTASGAVGGSKTKITTHQCTSATCPITLTIKGIVKVTPTGTVTFTIGHTDVGATGGGACAAYPMVPLRTATAIATCDAAGLSPGRVKITATYSGDSYFDPSTTTRTIRVTAAAGG